MFTHCGPETVQAIIDHSRNAERYWLPRVARYVMTPGIDPQQTERFGFGSVIPGEVAASGPPGLERCWWLDGWFFPWLGRTLSLDQLCELAMWHRQRRVWKAINDLFPSPSAIPPVDGAVQTRESWLEIIFREEMTVEEQDGHYRVVDDYAVQVDLDRVEHQGKARQG